MLERGRGEVGEESWLVDRRGWGKNVVSDGYLVLGGRSILICYYRI